MLPENNLKMRVISPEEESSYLTAAKQPLRDVATLILETGMRPGEVFDLHKEDISLEFKFLRILDGKTLFARRTIPLTRSALCVLLKRATSINSDLLFPSRHDVSRLLRWSHRPQLAALQKSAVLLPFRLYDLRHTALTRMAMAGVDLPTLRELAGHASIQMTMRYLYATPEHKRTAIKKFEAFRLILKH